MNSFTNKEEVIDVWDKSVKAEENSYYWKANPVVFKPINTSLKKGLTAAEFFCGCGGTSLGFEMAGFDILFGLDIHKPSIDTFRLNHNNSFAILGDIKKLNKSHLRNMLKLSHIDVLMAGVPCQGFSLNNRKRHQDDDRNFLYKEFIKWAKIIRPKFIVLENVSGMLSTGVVVEEIKKDINKQLRMKVEAKMLNAEDFGVPQRRKRLIFVGRLEEYSFSFLQIKKTHGLNKKHPFNTVYDAISDLPSLSSGEFSDEYLSDPKSDYQKLMRKGSKCLLNHRAPSHPEETIEKICHTKPGEPLYPRFKQRIRLAWNILSPTQVSGGIRPQFQFGHPSDSRGLTVRERCRIQSFPDTFEICGGIVQGRVQTGNAVPPLLAKAIAKAIKESIHGL